MFGLRSSKEVAFSSIFCITDLGNVERLGRIVLGVLMVVTLSYLSDSQSVLYSS